MTVPAGTNGGSLGVNFNFYAVPDVMRIYWNGTLIYDTGFTSGSGTFSVTYDPRTSTALTIVMNDGGGGVFGTIWDYTWTVTPNPLRYQWQFNGADLLGATNASLLITNTQTANFGSYRAIVSDGFGSVTSRVASLSAAQRPMVLMDGILVLASNVYARGAVTVSLLTTFANGTLLYTLDNSDPGFSARLYDSPFIVRKSATLRAIAYNADFTQAVQSDPVEIIILPTLSASTAGGGSVAMDPPAGAYLSNGTAVVTATPAPGWTFLQWLGDATGTNATAVVNMSRDKCVQAVFGTSVSNTVVGNGLVLRRPFSALYPYGSTARLTALPIGSNYFAFWGNAASGTNNPLTFVVTNANPTVTAVIAALSGGSVALVVTPNGFGEVNTSPRANRYNSGATVTLTALPEAGQTFFDWSGSVSGTNNPLVVTMNQSRLITANFSQRPRLSAPGCDGRFNDEEIQLLLTGEFGEQYWIVAATNLAPGATVWTPIGVVTNTFGTVQFNDAFVTNRAQRFYRAAQMVPFP